MKIVSNTPLWVLSKDGLSKHNLTGLINMARGGTEPHTIAVFTEEAEGQEALRRQELIMAVTARLEMMDNNTLSAAEATLHNLQNPLPH